MHRLKSLEKEIKAHEYCPDQIGYYFCCEFVDMTLECFKRAINLPNWNFLSVTDFMDPKGAGYENTYR